MDKKRYWIRENGESKGPYSMNQLFELNQTLDDYVWFETIDDWTQLKEFPRYVKELKNYLFKDKLKSVKLLSILSIIILFGMGFIDVYEFYGEGYFPGLILTGFALILLIILLLILLGKNNKDSYYTALSFLIISSILIVMFGLTLIFFPVQPY